VNVFEFRSNAEMKKKLICGPKDIKCPIKLFSIRGKVFSGGSSF
jgi:hypothetical protein